MSEARKLHIGAGKVHLPGFINMDLFDLHHQDVYCEMTRLPWDKGTFDLIYACHVLEHVHRRMVTATLHHWVEMLKPGGVLRLAVPNFDAICRQYSETGALEELMGLLYGGQNHPKNNHFVTFDYVTLKAHMTKAGLKDVRHWDWRQTEHAMFDDFSQAHLPHMHKDEGVLMSLNLEGTK